MPQSEAMFIRGPHDPIAIERAEGPWLYTRDGRKILDGGAGAVVVNIGQGREEIAEIARRTIARLDYVLPVWTSPERERLWQAAAREWPNYNVYTTRTSRIIPLVVLQPVRP